MFETIAKETDMKSASELKPIQKRDSTPDGCYSDTTESLTGL